MTRRKPLNNPALRKFGRELARLRNLADMSQDALGDALNISGSMIGHIERAERTPSKRLARRADELLGANGSLYELWPKVRKESYPEYAGDFLDAVPGATMMRDYHPLLIPGPLQVEDYAYATLRAGNPLAVEDEVTRLFEARMERQQALLAADTPLIWATIDEVAISRLYSDPAILVSQIAKLLKLAESGRVELQIVPQTVGIRRHPGLSGPFTILSFGDRPDVAYIEGVGSGNMISDPEAVEEISFLFGRLQAVALSPDQTMELLYKIKGESDGH